MGAALGSILGIAAAVFAPYAAAALGLSGIGATLFGLGLQLAVGSIFSKKAKKKAASGGVEDTGLLVNKTSNVAALPVIYGESSDTHPGRRLGGTRVYMQSTNNNGVTTGTGGNEYLHVVIAYAHGSGKANSENAGPVVHRILLNDKVAWTAANGKVVSGHPDYDATEYEGYDFSKFDVALFNGCTDQTHSVGRDYSTFDDFDARKSDEWTTAHKLQGVAYAYCRFQFDRDTFPGAPTILIESTGNKLHDVYQIQQGITGSGLYANKSNPANIIYNYLTDATYGKGLDANDIDIDSFVVARNYYNTIALDFIGVMQTGETIYDNVQQLLASCNANLYYSRGKYAISINKAENFLTGAVCAHTHVFGEPGWDNWSGCYLERNAATTPFIFNKDNILGEWTISLGSKANRFNSMTVNYYDSDNGWQPNSIKVDNASYLTADSDVLNEGGIDLPMVRTKTDAERLGKFYLDQSRYTTVVNFTASHEALQLDVNDICLVEHETPGWEFGDYLVGAGYAIGTVKRFRVSALVLNSDSTVDVTLLEYAPDTIYIENQ